MAEPLCSKCAGTNQFLTDQAIDQRLNDLEPKDVYSFLLRFDITKLLDVAAHGEPLHRDHVETFRKCVRDLLHIEER